MSYKIENKEQEHAAKLSFPYTTINNYPSLLIIGNLDIKNTGNIILSNPIIKLTFTPIYNISIRGQLIPEKMIDTLSVYNDSGPTGWSFTSTSDIKENIGTMLIKPINSVTIYPDDSITISNLQFHIMWSEDVLSASFQTQITFDEEKSSAETLSLSFEPKFTNNEE